MMRARLLMMVALSSSPVFAQSEAPAPVEASAAPTVAAVPADEGVVAVLELTASKGAEATASALASMLTAEVAALPGWRAVSRNELRSILSHAADAQLVGCADVTCSGDVARLMSAQRVLTGEVSKLDGAMALSLTLIDTSDGEPRIAARQEAAWRGRDDELLLLARPLVARLFDAENASRHMGSVEVFTVDGAAIFVDGKEVGTAPLASPLRDIATGAHTVRASKSGYRTLDMDVVVARNESTLARVELVEEALFDQPWFWAAAGGVVLVAGGAAAGITTWAVINQPEPTRVTLGKP